MNILNNGFSYCERISFCPLSRYVSTLLRLSSIAHNIGLYFSFYCRRYVTKQILMTHTQLNSTQNKNLFYMKMMIWFSGWTIKGRFPSNLYINATKVHRYIRITISTYTFAGYKNIYPIVQREVAIPFNLNCLICESYSIQSAFTNVSNSKNNISQKWPNYDVYKCLVIWQTTNFN